MLTLLESMLANALLPHDFKTGTKPSQHNTAGLGYLQSREGLTPTQLRVLEFVLAGLSNQEIAAECNLALGTVKNTVSSIMLVLNVNSRSHLISLFK
jgi:DNA-binding NarL/FixJ family response regulator